MPKFSLDKAKLYVYHNMVQSLFQNFQNFSNESTPTFTMLYYLLNADRFGQNFKLKGARQAFSHVNMVKWLCQYSTQLDT